MEKIEKTDAEWRAELTPEQYHVMRQKGTEPAFSGALYRNHADGTYRCGACGAELFSSDTKFESGSYCINSLSLGFDPKQAGEKE